VPAASCALVASLQMFKGFGDAPSLTAKKDDITPWGDDHNKENAAAPEVDGSDGKPSPASGLEEDPATEATAPEPVPMQA
jgi:hypothetical protein